MNSVADDDSSAHDSKRCVSCLESMVPGATKCPHCGSFQNWRRYLNLSTVMLSLLIALISVSTVGISIFKEVIIPKRAKLNVLILDKDGDLSFQLIVNNTGNAPGLIGIMIRPMVKNNEDWNITLYPYDRKERKEAEWPMEIPANSFKLINVKGHLRTPPDMEATQEKFGCKIEFTVIQTNGVKTVHETYCTEMKVK